MTQQIFEDDLPDDLVDQVRARRAISQRRSYSQRASKLEPYRAAIKKLHRGGASLRDIQLYLSTMARPTVKANPTTIQRYLERLVENERV